jgi:hypothetical protein
MFPREVLGDECVELVNDVGTSDHEGGGDEHPTSVNGTLLSDEDRVCTLGVPDVRIGRLDLDSIQALLPNPCIDVPIERITL